MLTAEEIAMNRRNFNSTILSDTFNNNVETEKRRVTTTDRLTAMKPI
jgi:hypothetical protein